MSDVNNPLPRDGSIADVIAAHDQLETRIEHVPEYTKKSGVTVPAHDRVVPAKRKPKKTAYDPIGHRTVPKHKVRKKPGPKLGKPRFTTAAHAQHIYEQLDVPIAFLLGLEIRNNTQQDYMTAAMIGKALRAIDDVRVFINRFTATPDKE